MANSRRSAALSSIMKAKEVQDNYLADGKTERGLGYRIGRDSGVDEVGGFAPCESYLPQPTFVQDGVRSWSFAS